MASDSSTPFDRDQYALSRGFAASTRLNLQHYLWKDVIGYNLHPAIPVRDDPDFRIADVGTGTGVWLIDLSRQLPSAHLDGYDISDKQYPPKQWLPANLSLQTLDVFSPIPEALIRKYDIIHVRLFILVVRDDDPTPILRNLMSMLKPGGYIQWAEHNHDTITIAATNPSVKRTATEQVLDGMRRRVRTSWVSCLPETFRQLGLIDVSSKSYPVSPELRSYFNHLQIMACEEVSYTAMGSGPGSNGAEYRRLIQESFDEIKLGVTFLYSPGVVIGRKPL